MTKNKQNTQALTVQTQKGEEALRQQAQSFHDGNQQIQELIEAAEFVGSANAVQRIADSLNAQALQAWEIFQQEEKYKAYGCATFVEFLERHPRLGLTKTKYYERKQLLANEGAEIFDLLNTLQIPFKVRRQLTAGDLQIDGNELIVQEQRYPIDDPKKIKRALTQVIEQMERVESRSVKLSKESEKLKAKLAIAQEDARIAAMGIPNDDLDPVHQAYLRVIADLTTLGRELGELPAAEAEQRLAQYRPDISQAVEILFTISAANSPTRRPDQPQEQLGLDAKDLADLMED